MSLSIHIFHLDMHGLGTCLLGLYVLRGNENTDIMCSGGTIVKEVSLLEMCV